MPPPFIHVECQNLVKSLSPHVCMEELFSLTERPFSKDNQLFMKNWLKDIQLLDSEDQ